MYNCDNCGKTSQPKEKCHIVPIHTRAKKYNNNGIISYGYETVKEIKLCGVCNEQK